MLGPIEVVEELYVDIARVLGVGLARERACDDLPLAHVQDVVEVDHRLAPVRVLCVGPRREADLAVRELHVKVRDEGVHVVVPVRPEREGDLVEGHVREGRRGDVVPLDGAVVGDDRVRGDGVDEGLRDGEALDAAHVEAVDVLPPPDLGRLVLGVLDGVDVQGALVGEHETPGLEPLVAGVDHGLQHGLEHKEVSHPLGDEHVDFLGKIDVFDLPADKRDLVFVAVKLYDFTGLFDNPGTVDAVNMLGAGTGGKKTENACATPNVEDYLVFYNAGSTDGFAITVGTYTIF